MQVWSRENSIEICTLLWRRKWQPIPVLLLWKSHGWRSVVGYSPWGCKESDTTEWLHSLDSSFTQSKQHKLQEKREKQILSASEIRQEILLLQKLRQRLTVSAKRLEAKVTCSQEKKKWVKTLRANPCTNIKQISENAGKGLENSTAAKTTYSSKVKFGYHGEGGRNIRKKPTSETQAHRVWRMKLYKKIKNYASISNIRLQPNNKQQQLTTKHRDIPHLMA